jgi:3-deoxy-D-manno-octulosonate 8-phosphate phosphatase (KDO 8-P phosphatase)
MKPSLTTNQFSHFPQAIERAQQVKLLVLDVDGVLTDGSLLLGEDGIEHIKKFDSLDGHGIKLLISRGIDVAIISGRSSPMVEMRAKSLGIKHIFLGIENKKSVFQELLRNLKLSIKDCGAMGDDWPDLSILNIVQFAAAPANAHLEVRNIVHFISQQRGGNGAVREICDLILFAQNHYGDLLKDALK